MNERTDVWTGAEAHHDAGHGAAGRRPGGRRLVRWITVLTVGIVAVLAIWQDTLS